MHRNLLVSATLFLSAFVGGCSADSPDETHGSSASAQAAVPGDEIDGSRSSAPSLVTISDDEIDSYIAWWRAELDLGRERVREMDELLERLDKKYSLADLDKVQEDPELLAMLERQREEAMERKRNTPIAQEKAEGFDSVLAGLGRTVNREGRTIYEVHHEERALQGARDKYGDEFVDKVLSREDDIAAAMNP
jgi:hypothetical protein